MNTAFVSPAHLMLQYLFALEMLGPGFDQRETVVPRRVVERQFGNGHSEAPEHGAGPVPDVSSAALSSRLF
jgi:hypothetical protein